MCTRLLIITSVCVCERLSLRVASSAVNAAMDDINNILRDLSLFEPNSQPIQSGTYARGKSGKPCRPPPPPPVTQTTTIKKAAIPLPSLDNHKGDIRQCVYHFIN